MNAWPRRAFIKKSGVVAAGASLFPLPQIKLGDELPASHDLEIHIFSKHLQFLDCSAAAEVAANLGFAGLDLTVRPGGHVAPELAEAQLPAAIEAIRRSGSHCRLITTAVDDASDPADLTLLQTAAKSGVTHYRMNWYRYPDNEPMKSALVRLGRKIASLAETNQQLGLVGCYQNHAGNIIGSSMWELEALLQDSDPDAMGIQYDIRHASVEAGLSWENGLRLVHNQIKTLALKDFKWQYSQGRWQVINTPIGEGMVDFTRFFKLLKQYGVSVPASLHLEYPLGGAEHGHDELKVAPDILYGAMKKDLNTIKHLWEEA
jgi:sugar phosphate isomerase/epimerase